MVAALFPDWRSIGRIDRVALSFALSIAIAPSIGLILNYTPWHITFLSVFISLIIFIFVMSAVALIRRRGLPAESFPDFRFPPVGWSRIGGLDKLINVALVVSILVAFGSLAYVSLTPKKLTSNTEFYILGLPERQMVNYPLAIKLGSPAKVILGITNHEHNAESYMVKVYVDGIEGQVIGPVDIEDGQVWEKEVSVIPSKAGKGQRVEFVLFRGDAGQPLDRVWFWVDVG